MLKSEKIFVAGHRGMVGSAIVRELTAQGYENIVTVPRTELDLFRQQDVEDFFSQSKIDHVFIAAAKVGGIEANRTQQYDFLYENLMIGANIVNAAAKFDVKKLISLGSSCIYPKFAEIPIKEESLFAGAVEPTNEGYAVAKIATLKLCEMYQRQYGKTFISAMPTSIYGVGDNFHPTHSHVIPALLRRYHEAKKDNKSEVVMWGTGTPLRQFLYVDDLAKALIVLMNEYKDQQTINIGGTDEISIGDLSKLIAKIVGFEGEIKNDLDKPDGTPRKGLNCEKISALGWKPTVGLEDGIRTAYNWALDNNLM